MTDYILGDDASEESIYCGICCRGVYEYVVDELVAFSSVYEVRWSYDGAVSWTSCWYAVG